MYADAVSGPLYMSCIDPLDGFHETAIGFAVRRCKLGYNQVGKSDASAKSDHSQAAHVLHYQVQSHEIGLVMRHHPSVPLPPPRTLKWRTITAWFRHQISYVNYPGLISSGEANHTHTHNAFHVQPPVTASSQVVFFLFRVRGASFSDGRPLINRTRCLWPAL